MGLQNNTATIYEDDISDIVSFDRLTHAPSVTDHMLHATSSTQLEFGVTVSNTQSSPRTV